ncbi:hypothetical protein [Domibacillus robiginosus]|uniref:hypothetical protein n=1 Tax=Domibacillus robiginosus TaxID=1071054 RepID=UPI000AC017E0|nr:hypothetical protein [Domibacillus robiginosus]
MAMKYVFVMKGEDIAGTLHGVGTSFAKMTNMLLFKGYGIKYVTKEEFLEEEAREI